MSSTMSSGASPLMFTIKNRRYGVPASFLDSHPGGHDMIALGIGRNCTELFVSYHIMSDKPERMLEQWYMGDAKKGDEDYCDLFDWDKTPVLDDVKREVRAYFGNRSMSHKAGTAKWIYYMMMILAVFASFYLFARGWWVSLLLLPLSYWFGPGQMLHDGSHFTLSKSPLVNRLSMWVGGLHMDPFTWFHQHVIAHHAYTNIRGSDPDVVSFDGYPGAIFGHRSSPWTPWRIDFRRWLRSVIISMPFSCIQPSLKQDWNVWWKGSYDGGTVPVTVPISALQRGLHFFFRWVLFATVFIVIPFMTNSALKALAFGVIPIVVYGCIYYVFSQVSHISEECFINNRSGGEWVVWQIHHSLDYATQSLLWRFLSDALNLQTVHHVFPPVDSWHYIPLTKILLGVCKKHKIQMNTRPTFASALNAHFEHIWSINSEVNNHGHIKAK